jgi:hypothetical protein
MTQQATESQAPQMVTAAEARAQLKIGKTKFYDLINAGELHAHDISPNRPSGPRRVGDKGHRRVLRISQAEIDRYLAATAVSA